ncbi:unnamed protein product [Clonostachys byssicola]|uniref:TauD/TfdA-like domain-containing protein n=1 Tax=Clonostachys byssicola TaxID=160290 RepID=A0A9N9XX50_9HYPO|nr:unnamed protein product [Clonostachys byssicola]
MATQTITETVAKTSSVPISIETSVNHDKHQYQYAGYLPVYDARQIPPLEEFAYEDPGLRADPSKAALLGAPGAKFEELTPAIGTEVRGLQLSSLDSKQRDELALLTAERGVLVFHDQDFKDIGYEKQEQFGAHFGKLHIHQRGSQVAGHPYLLPVYRDFKAGASDQETDNHVSSVKWHSDMSYEINGAGITTFLVLDTPGVGGDTLYLSTVAAYEKLSPLFREKLEGLTAIHSGKEQYAGGQYAERYNRPPIETSHPVVRTHPVTKSKSLYVNSLWTKRIEGLKQEESDFLLKFLTQHIEHGQDFHIRVKWTPGTVVIYDNRITQHSALRDFKVEEGTTRRHMLRITPQAERPYFDPNV